MTITRESVRALVIDNDRRILLSRVTPLDGTIKRDLWVTLGGRLKEAEDLAVALKRELVEELAESRYKIGPKVWIGDEIVNWGGKELRLLEHFYIVHVLAQDYQFVGQESEEALSTHELRWWTADEITASDAKFVPCDLGKLLAELTEGAHPEPRHVRLEKMD